MLYQIWPFTEPCEHLLTEVEEQGIQKGTLDYRFIHHSGDMKRFPAIFLKFLCTLLPWLAELSAESAQQQTLMSRLLLHDSLVYPCQLFFPPLNLQQMAICKAPAG